MAIFDGTLICTDLDGTLLRKDKTISKENLDAIEYFKELNYINDNTYIERAVKEYMALKNMSIKELSYKICQKGIAKKLLDDYICQNKESMLEYEISSAKAIIIKKKNNLEEQEIKNFLFKKGFMSESVSIAFDELS